MWILKNSQLNIVSCKLEILIQIHIGNTYYINVIEKEYHSFINLKYNLKKLPGINISPPKSSRNIDVYVTNTSLKEV